MSKERKLRIAARILGAAAILASGIAGVACAGGEEKEEFQPSPPVPTVGKTPEATPTILATVQPTPAPAETSMPSPYPSPEPTLEPTQEPTPEATLEQAIAKLESIIYEVQNPDPEIAANYDPPVAWEIRLNTLLEGAPDLEIVGLNDVMDALNEGNIELAGQRMRENPSGGVFGGLFGGIISPMGYASGEGEPVIDPPWLEEDLNRLDPQRIFTGQVSGLRPALVRTEAAIKFLELYYDLEALSP